MKLYQKTLWKELFTTFSEKVEKISPAVQSLDIARVSVDESF
jgi:hypothetical protein